MRKNRKALYLSSAVTHARFKSPEGNGGATSAAPAAGGDNPPVTGDSSTGGEGTNSGQPFDYSSFWATNKPDDGNGDSLPNGQDAGKELGTQLLGEVKGFKVNDVFTTEALEKMASGDLTALNSGINTAFQAGMGQMLNMTATIMQSFEQHFEKRIEGLIGSRLNASKTSANDERLLTDNFKGYADPAARPMIQGTFNKALEHTKGNRQDALKLTRDMLAVMGKASKDDLGFGNFRSPDDNLDEGPSRLVQELLELRKP
jgi:hypothetical protein